MKVWLRPKDNGKGSYRWCPIVSTPGGLALGSIYRQTPDDISPVKFAELVHLADKYDFHEGATAP